MKPTKLTVARAMTYAAHVLAQDLKSLSPDELTEVVERATLLAIDARTELEQRKAAFYCGAV